MQPNETAANARIANAPEIVDEDTEELILQYRYGARTYGLAQPAVVDLDHVIRNRQATFTAALRRGL